MLRLSNIPFISYREFQMHSGTSIGWIVTCIARQIEQHPLFLSSRHRYSELIQNDQADQAEKHLHKEARVEHTLHIPIQQNRSLDPSKLLAPSVLFYMGRHLYM